MRNMSVAPNTKLMLTGAALLIAVVSCSVAITSDDPRIEPDNKPLTSAKIVENIRMAMNKTTDGSTPVHAYIIPSVDAHFSEVPSVRDRRVQYVSGFTGSFANVVITENAAALWTDSRYHAQAERQLDKNVWTLIKMGIENAPKMEEWLVKTLPKNSVVGIDPYLITEKEYSELETYLKERGHVLIDNCKNFVDEVWRDRPELKLKDLEPIGSQFSGKSVKDKLADVREAIRKLNAESFIVTALEDIAWLLNLRGSDLEYSPLFYAYVTIGENNTSLYLLKEDRATTDKIDNHFQTEKVDIIYSEYNTTKPGILSFIRTTEGKVILSSASRAIETLVPPNRRLEIDSPIMNLRIIKNDVEAQGMREAHKRDGAAFIKYLYWLENQIDDQNITELRGAEKLKNLKSAHDYYRQLSFETVSAVGAHAAMAHYTPVPEMDKQITRNEIYLIDAGTQYKDGTTDITRTIHFGNATEGEKDAFTRVLKGFIAVATAIFPPNAPLSYFDALARRALWEVGLNYNHGTGHGVGAYLNVHEYPPLISSRNSATGMCKNMFTTNEPGYYEDKKFGVRIENVLQVVDLPDSSKHFEGKGALKFEDVTMVPIQTKLINIDLMTDNEIDWLNQYHERVRSTISPLLTNHSDIIEWLERETKKISRQKKENNTADKGQNTTDAPTES